KIHHSVYLAISRLQHVVRTMDATVDAIAHDIRTPLSRIQLSSEKALLSQLKSSEREGELENALSDCAEYAIQASSMLKALMKLNDELTNKQQIQNTQTDITDVFKRVAHWYEDIAEEKKISIECVTTSNTVFNLDADKLSQILVNLIDNALKYTNIGGKITLSSISKKNGEIEIKVTDNGIGIAKEYHKLIFQRLYRVDTSRSNTENYGLGLSLASAMVKNLGATLTVESAVGKGSCFTIKLNL
ncbi:MAG: signal transduction histidine kinase, partial [Oceanospirillaceae bacterium]